jgi:hypothetical protein
MKGEIVSNNGHHEPDHIPNIEWFDCIGKYFAVISDVDLATNDPDKTVSVIERVHVLNIAVIEVVHSVYEVMLDAIMGESLESLENISRGTTAILDVGT